MSDRLALRVSGRGHTASVADSKSGGSPETPAGGSPVQNALHFAGEPDAPGGACGGRFAQPREKRFCETPPHSFPALLATALPAVCHRPSPLLRVSHGGLGSPLRSDRYATRYARPRPPCGHLRDGEGRWQTAGRAPRAMPYTRRALRCARGTAPGSNSGREKLP